MNKVKYKFAQIKTDQAEIYCKPEIFALGCFFEPSMISQRYIAKFLKLKLGDKFTQYGIPQQMLYMAYEWFIPKVTYQNSKIVAITDRFWKNKATGTLAHKLPTLRDKDFIETLGIGRKNSTAKMQDLCSTGLVKSYIDAGVAINKNCTKIRYIQLNVPLFLSIAYSSKEIGVAHSLILERRNQSKFFKDVYIVIEKAFKLSLEKSCVRIKYALN